MKFVPKTMRSKLRAICKDEKFREIGADEELDQLATTLKKSNRPADIFDALLPLKITLEDLGQKERAMIISDILESLME
jgi:hypothetical protein